MNELSPGKWWGLRRLATSAGLFQMTAVDQRPPIKNLVAEQLDQDADLYDEVANCKALLVETLQTKSSAMLLDPHYAIPRALRYLEPTKGLVVTLEDSIFDEQNGGRLSKSINNWDVGKIKRLGADAVKVLVWYRPDAPEDIRAAQHAYVKLIGEQCVRCDIAFLLEMLAYPLPDDERQTTDYVEMADKKIEYVLGAVEEFAKPEYGVDVFKLESPLGADTVPALGAKGSDDALRVFVKLGELAGRPWVMLSAGASPEAFINVLSHACAAGASGYLAGRSIWMRALANYPDQKAIRSSLLADSLPYMDHLNKLTAKHATAWFNHICYGPNGASFTPAQANFRDDYATL